jgi:hypothetical protein
VPGRDLPGSDPAAKYAPAPPYTLDAVCELSEDYFLVQNRDIDPVKDTVIAYSSGDHLCAVPSTGLAAPVRGCAAGAHARHSPMYSKRRRIPAGMRDRC